MATQSLTRSILSKPQALTFLLARPFSSVTSTSSAISRSPFSLLRRLRPLSAAVPAVSFRRPSLRSLSTNATSSSLSDPNPNWSNRPPKETILLDGCDFEHWLVVVEKPQGEPTRDEIIDGYIKILAQIVGSEEEARMKIYSVSTKCYFAFGCIVSEELSYKIKELPGVRWVLPDSYLDVKNQNYGGEPFIDGQAVPYDPKYHEEWIRNNARAMDRNKRNDRPRNFDRSRNFDRRRENMQNRDFQNSPNQATQNQGKPPQMSNQPAYNQDIQNQPMNNQNSRHPPMPNQTNQPSHNQDFRNPQMNNRDFQGPPRPNQPMNNQNFQNLPPIPNQPMHNQNFQNPPPMHNQNFQNPPPIPNQPMHNQNFQNPPPMPNQPMHNQNFQNPPPMPNQPIQDRDAQNSGNGGTAYYNGGQQNYYEPMTPTNMEWAPPSNVGGTPPPNAEWPGGNAPNRDTGYPQNFRNRDY